MIKQITIVLCFIVLLSNLAACSSSDGLTGRTISILDIIGTNATVTKADAKEYNAKKGLRLGADYGASTGDVTYVYFNLDDKSLAKMDEISKVSVAQISENKLRLNLVDGAILINERGKRAGDLEIRAGNIAIGIRGTFITAKYDGAGMTVFIIDGVIDVTTASGDATPVGALKRVAVVNDVVTVTDLKWSMLDQFTRDCIMEYQDDLSGNLSEDDFDAINNISKSTDKKGELITVQATVIWNLGAYSEKYATTHEQYEPLAVASYGILFDSPMLTPDGAPVSEAGILIAHDNKVLSVNDPMPLGRLVLTGYLYHEDDYTEEFEYVRGREGYEDIDYYWRPNGPYVFELESYVAP